MDTEDNIGIFGSEGFSEFGSELGSERSIVTARGTGDGLVIRLDGRADRQSLKEAFEDFVNSRKKFLAGNDVVFEWVGAVPEAHFVDELSQRAKELDIQVKSSSLKEGKTVSSLKDEIEVEGSRSRDKQDQKVSTLPSSALGASSVGKGGKTRRSNENISLFGGIDSYPFEDEVKRSARSNPERNTSTTGIDSNVWDDADARIIFSTIRSGQKIETEHSIVIFGDVNSGAELVAGGDIVVLGTLRGVAHSGAYDETGGGRVIFALNLQPTQLRIGAVISRGSSSDGNRGAEIARVDGTVIAVEPYSAKGILTRRRDQ